MFWSQREQIEASLYGSGILFKFLAQTLPAFFVHPNGRQPDTW